VTIALTLNFSQLELPASLFPSKKDSVLIDSKNNTTPVKEAKPNPSPIEKSLLQTDNPKKIIKEAGNINIWTEKSNYQIGDKLQLSFTVDRPMYIKIVTINSEGKLVTLFPNPYQTKNFCEPNINYQIPPKNAEFTLDIDPPKGQDKIAAIGSSKPIPDRALILDSAGKILDPKLRQSLIYKSIAYTIN